MDHDFSEITSVEELETAATEATEAANVLAQRARDGEVLTATERAELAGHFDRRDAARARIAEVQAAEAAAQAEQDELLNRLDAPAEPEAPEAAAPVAPEAPASETPAPEAVAPEVPAEEAPVSEPTTMDALAAAIVAAVNASAQEQEAVTAAGTPTRRPVPRPEVTPGDAVAGAGVQVAITASANLANIGISATVDLDQVATMIGARGLSYPKPNGSAKDQSKEARLARLQSAPRDPVAQFTITRDDDHTLTGDPEIDEPRIAAAMDPSKVVGFNGEQGLTAAGGWCSPSEILYGIPVVGESLAGLASFPEMNAARGGIKSTLGPDFSTLYDANVGYFEQTEAEAIAGETKDCYEIDCPSFTETRMDVTGVCLSIPILTEAGYPEYVERITKGALAVHAHKLNAKKIAAVVAGSTAVTALDVSSVAESTLHSLELRAEYQRQLFRMEPNEVLEVKIPYWVLPYLREDFALRMTGDPSKPVQDSWITAHFAARHLSVEFVYDWQTFADPMTSAPTTFIALIYPAGTWLVLSKDVISLSTVYDAAGLSVNTYTGTFTEQGVGVRKMTNARSEKVTIPICARGRVGAANITCS